jgi:FSR family fosmidomycin resistance protein-like MFS transporter
VVVTASIAEVALLAGFMLTSGIVAWLLLALYGIALFSTLPLTVLIAQDIVPENRSFGSGLSLGFANALGAVGVLILGPVAEAYGPATALWVTVICGVVAIPLAVSLRRH